MLFPGGEYAPVFAVIDGMGGHQHEAGDGTLVTGREAAQIVRTTLIEDLQHLPLDADASPGSEVEGRVIDALMRSHHRLMSELNSSGKLVLTQRVGAVATVVVVCEQGQRLLVVQIGDTRGYLFTEGELIQLCPDEDNIEYFVRQGLLSPEDGDRISTILNTYDGVNEPDARGTVTIAGTPYDLYIAWRWFLVGNTVLNIPPANIVINALGVHDANPTSQTSRIEIAPGDALVLCSDGLYKNLTEAEIMAGLAADHDNAVALGEAAFARSQSSDNRRSTHDDVSIIVAQF
jgi:serine/threonine protein phosphatase PrpC